MKQIISTIMCLSFVTGTYEVVVDTYNWERQWLIGGDLRSMCWRKCDSQNCRVSEEYVRSILSENQWEKLCSDEIIECEIRIDK